MPNLPDPRAYGNGGDSLSQIAQRCVDAACADRKTADAALIAHLRAHLEAGRDAEIRRALQGAPSRAAGVRLRAMLARALDGTGDDASGTVLARLFALPLLLVTGGTRQSLLPGALPDIAAVRRVLEEYGALGQTRNFGLSNALVSAEALASIPPSWIRELSLNFGGTFDLLGTSVPVETTETVHLRFLVGAGVAAANAPSFLETASNIGAWGLPFTANLREQLNQNGASVLPIPRPPKNLIEAVDAGCFALRELEFNLWLSGALRRFRAAVGEPVARIAAHEPGEIRVGLQSVFDAGFVDGFRWPLSPLDDIDAVFDSIIGLLRDCRVNDIRVSSLVQPDREPGGAPLIWHDDMRQ